MSDFDILKTEENTRLFVINKSLIIEKRITELICTLLNIDRGSSKSFGSGSGSLSFAQKLQLIYDIRSLDKTQKKKLRTVLEIRNKFAHVIEIDSFNALFKIASKGKEIRKDLILWYPVNNKRDNDYDENNFKHMFFNLFLDITSKILINITLEFTVIKMHEDVKASYENFFVSAAKEILSESEEGQTVLNTLEKKASEFLEENQNEKINSWLRRLSIE